MVCFHPHSYSCMPHLTIIFIQCTFPCMLWEYACFSMHVGTRMCGRLCTCVCMCTRRCKVDVGNLPGWLFCLIYWGVIPQSNSELLCMASLVCQFVLGICCLYLPRLDLEAGHQPIWHSGGFLVIRILSLCLHSKCLAAESFPQPLIPHFW